MGGLVLSLFPGIGLLDMAFEEEGYCVVRGPDVLWGGDVRQFHPPAGVFEGVIGGPPCQEFSQVRRIEVHQGASARHVNLIPDFERVVSEVQPEWFVMENVRGAPLPVVAGYEVRSQLLNNRWFGGEQNRVRRISFGMDDGRGLVLAPVALEAQEWAYAVTWQHGSNVRKATGKTGYTVAEACRYQGLPEDHLDEAPFTVDAKKHVLANGVPLVLGRAIARAVSRAMQRERAV